MHPMKSRILLLIEHENKNVILKMIFKHLIETKKLVHNLLTTCYNSVRANGVP